jgi:hypothetical protein
MQCNNLTGAPYSRAQHFVDSSPPHSCPSTPCLYTVVVPQGPMKTLVVPLLPGGLLWHDYSFSCPL